MITEEAIRFEIDGNSWLDEQERAEMKKQACETREAHEQRQLSRRRLSQLTFLVDKCFSQISSCTLGNQQASRAKIDPCRPKLQNFQARLRKVVLRTHLSRLHQCCHTCTCAKTCAAGQKGAGTLAGEQLGGYQDPRLRKDAMTCTTSSSEPHRSSKMVGAANLSVEVWILRAGCKRKILMSHRSIILTNSTRQMKTDYHKIAACQ